MVELSLVVGLVVLTSAACSLFEAVLYSVPRSQVDALERAGHPGGAILRTLQAQVDRPIAAILSLNTVANTGGAALAGAIASRVFSSVWIGYFSAAFTLAILLFSEIIPKTAGVVYAHRLAGPIARPLRSWCWCSHRSSGSAATSRAWWQSVARRTRSQTTTCC